MTTFQRLVLQGLAIIIDLLEHGFGLQGDIRDVDGHRIKMWQEDVAEIVED